MLGRQTIRRAIQRVRSNQTPTNTDGAVNDGIPPKSLPGIRFPEISTTIEPPLAMDTDAEKAFANNGTAWYFRRGRPNVGDAVESGMSTPVAAGFTSTTDPLRSPVIRRKWAEDLLDSRGSPDGDLPASRERSPTAHRAGGSAQSTFFGRIGRKSASALSLPFSSPLKSSRVVRSREPSQELSSDKHEPPWSSDSSSEDETTPYELRHTWAAGLSPLVQDTQDESNHGGPLQDADSD